MYSVFFNTFTVILGSLLGLGLKKSIPETLTTGVMTGIGLCTMVIGITGVMAGENTLVLILSVVLGVFLGELFNLDGRINSLVQRVSSASGADSSTFSQGFLTACLMFCMGAMTIVGSLNAGLRGNHEMLMTKSILDFISSMMLAATLGIGVLCSAGFVLVFQGGIVLLAQYIAPFLSDSVIQELTCTGSLMILALGLNILGITKIKVINFLPALALVPPVCWMLSHWGIG